MKIFAIGDLHLSFGETVEKPMDIFGGQWIGHTEKLYKSWHEKISDEDILRILEGKDREMAGYTAPACGLTLYQVTYEKEH